VQVDERVAFPGDNDRDLTHLPQSLTASRLPVLDLVDLGFGPDGHTASLVPGDPVLTIKDTSVAVTAPYHGRRRVTLTFPIIDRSRRILWVVTGSDKEQMSKSLIEGDESIPAGQVRRQRSLILADSPGAEHLTVKPGKEG
jgi:6-phosphogluconolactonase